LFSGFFLSISVADAFDAMTSDRIYRKHLDSIVVIKMKGAGTQFDPEIAEAMLDLIKTEKIKLNYSDLLGQIGLAETLNTLYPDKEFYDAAD
jgi:HD-GYP domain-containing protein (c-di-GMP phosphodiesterase class II)